MRKSLVSAQVIGFGVKILVYIASPPIPYRLVHHLATQGLSFLPLTNVLENADTRNLDVVKLEPKASCCIIFGKVVKCEFTLTALLTKLSTF